MFLQLLSVDIMQFTLTEIKKTLLMTNMKYSFITREGQGKKKNSEFQTGSEPMISQISVENLLSFIIYYNITY